MHSFDTQRLRPKQLAAELGVSVSTIRRHIRDGSIPAYRLGETGSILIPAEAEGVADLLRPVYDEEERPDD